MSGKSSQRKGAAGEAELRDLFRAEGYDVERGGYCFGQRPDILGLPGVHIECKRVEKLNLHHAMQQAAADAERFQDGFPAVFHRRNREGWLVTMSLEGWKTLYRAFWRDFVGDDGRC